MVEGWVWWRYQVVTGEEGCQRLSYFFPPGTRGFGKSDRARGGEGDEYVP